MKKRAIDSISDKMWKKLGSDTQLILINVCSAFENKIDGLNNRVNKLEQYNKRFKKVAGKILKRIEKKKTKGRY